MDCATKVAGLSMSVIAIVPLVLRTALVSVRLTTAGVMTAASFVPLTVTTTVRVVPSAVVMLKLSVTELVAPSACTFAAALLSV